MKRTMNVTLYRLDNGEFISLSEVAAEDLIGQIGHHQEQLQTLLTLIDMPGLSKARMGRLQYRADSLNETILALATELGDRDADEESTAWQPVPAGVIRVHFAGATSLLDEFDDR